MRTAAEGVSTERLRADMLFLQKLWEAIEESIARSQPGDLVYEDLPLALRVLRDLLSSEMERVRVDSESTFNEMKDFADQFVSHISPTIEYYADERPIFDLYGEEDEKERALESGSWLTEVEGLPNARRSP